MKKTLLVLGILSSLASAKTAPSFKNVDTLAGGKASLDTVVKKDRLVLLSFWATWCLPCLQELTSVTEKLKKDPSIPLDLVTVNVDREDRSEVPVTMRQLGFSFPVILDPTNEIFGRYQKAATLPYSVLINPQKEIEAEFSGYHESMFDKIQVAAAKLKKAEAAPAAQGK